MGYFKEIATHEEGIALHLSALGKQTLMIQGRRCVQLQNRKYLPIGTCEFAIVYLANMCNHAMSRDKKGFSKYDQEFGHELAGKIISWGKLTQGQLKAIQKTKEDHGRNGLLTKYRKQLESVGIDHNLLLRQEAKLNGEPVTIDPKKIPSGELFL